MGDWLQDKCNEIQKAQREHIQKSFGSEDIEKARSGVYKPTKKNLKEGRAGQKYGQKKEEEKLDNLISINIEKDGFLNFSSNLNIENYEENIRNKINQVGEKLKKDLIDSGKFKDTEFGLKVILPKQTTWTPFKSEEEIKKENIERDKAIEGSREYVKNIIKDTNNSLYKIIKNAKSEEGAMYKEAMRYAAKNK